MDMSLVYAAVGAKVGTAQMQIATSLLKTNADSERETVQTMLASAQQSTNSLANVAANVGGSLNITA